MEFIKRLTSAIFLALVISIPLLFLESLLIYNVIQLYDIPHLKYLEYQHILGAGFIFMMTRNRIHIREKIQTKQEFLKDILDPSINRLFRIGFVWGVALTIDFFISLM